MRNSREERSGLIAMQCYVLGLKLKPEGFEPVTGDGSGWLVGGRV